jgi:hypothetical protein
LINQKIDNIDEHLCFINQIELIYITNSITDFYFYFLISSILIFNDNTYSHILKVIIKNITFLMMEDLYL